jgi:hypothetical protein
MLGGEVAGDADLLLRAGGKSEPQQHDCER